MSNTRKIVKRIFGALAIVMLVGTALNWRMIHMVATFNPIVLSANYNEPESTEEARLQDLSYLRKFISIDRSFSDAARTEFTQHINELEKQAANLSDAELYLAVSKSAALADNGHTNTSTQPLIRQFNSIGAKLYWFEDGLFIVRADAEHTDTVANRVTAIEGRSIDSVADTLRQYRGGSATWRKLAMPMMIETPDIMHAAGLAALPSEITLSLESSNGDTRDVTFRGHKAATGTVLPYRSAWVSLLPEVLPDEDDNWTRSLKLENAPLFLRETDRPIFTPLADNGHYIRTKTGFGTKEQSVQAFFQEALAGIDDGTLDYLVVDYRWNSGGDLNRSIDFAKLAPSKLKEDGKLYLLVGSNTFSASIATVAMLKFYGGEKSIIVGSPMGDHDHFWAERGMSFDLPNSKFHVGYATGYHDWNTGCDDHRYCYTFTRMYGVPAGSLEPTVTIEPTYAEYQSGRDIVMDWIKSNHKPAD